MNGRGGDGATGRRGESEAAPPSATAASVYFVDGEVERDIREALAGSVVQHGWGLLEMNSVRMNLEDIFLSLTTEEAE